MNKARKLPCVYDLYVNVTHGTLHPERDPLQSYFVKNTHIIPLELAIEINYKGDNFLPPVPAAPRRRSRRFRMQQVTGYLVGRPNTRAGQTTNLRQRDRVLYL